MNYATFKYELFLFVACYVILCQITGGQIIWITWYRWQHLSVLKRFDLTENLYPAVSGVEDYEFDVKNSKWRHKWQHLALILKNVMICLLCMKSDTRRFTRYQDYESGIKFLNLKIKAMHLSIPSGLRAQIVMHIKLVLLPLVPSNRVLCQCQPKIVKQRSFFIFIVHKNINCWHYSAKSIKQVNKYSDSIN